MEIAVYGHAFFKMERTIRLAEYTFPQELLVFVIHFGVESWSLDALTFGASVIHLSQLWENSCPFGDHSANFNESVEMDLSKVTRFVFNWEVLDSHENLFCGVLVVWVHFGYKIFSHIVQNRKHKGGLFG